MVATQHDNNMVVTQHGSSTKHGTNIIGYRQQHKGQEGKDNITSREAGTTVSKSVRGMSDMAQFSAASDWNEL